ncbi:sulfatase-like hydrolase/transferase [Novipirellula artificiosorum]|uniref:Choline-sulfatase n=1 Tax=Novipirellula artificiosorum TaxID=2528016 RepID=A0A5C6D2I6_9BACT|nr:sulfatase-like hydrolase/transferase [Novipirellula artificiosorum]TWU29069.1 Choline-sulfatase [Novipirellula artificiosorum]
MNDRPPMTTAVPLLRRLCLVIGLLLSTNGFGDDGETTDSADQRAAVHLLSEEWMRDPYIVLHRDGNYYLTCTRLGHTTGGVQGIETWKSTNLTDWTPAGVPWTFDDSSWIKDVKPRPQDRKDEFWLWAPELHFLNDRWVGVHTTNRGRANLLVSKSPSITSEYTEPMENSFGHRHDPFVFNHDDGSNWLVWACAKIAKLKPDFSGFEGKEISIRPSDRKLGHEGCVIRKIGSKYVLFGTAWSTDQMRHGTYNLYYCTADNLTGPYGPRQFAGRFCGHGTPFQDKSGRWWTTAFLNGQYETDPVKGQALIDQGKAWTLNPKGLTLVPLDVRIQEDSDVRVRAIPTEYANPGPEEVQQFDVTRPTFSVISPVSEPSFESAQIASGPKLQTGDWIVNDSQTVTGQHIRLRGNLILDPGAELTLVDCTIELIGDRSRDHIVDWRGGNLTTRNTTIGGGLVDGRAIHTVFHVYNGRWDATDTVVQYAYGISFGRDASVPSVLRATRLTAGPRHDAILLANHGDVELTDCNFPIAVGVFADQGGEVSLDLPVGKPVSMMFDKTVIPGCTYRAKLTRHTVDGQWFVFVRSIKPADEAPPYTVVLNDCPKVLPSVLSWNVKADLRISKDLSEPLVVGNTTIKRGEHPPGITMWSFYGGGDRYDLTLRGSNVRIAEFMHRGGRARILGDPDADNLFNLGCTTLEMSNDAQLQLSHVHLGRPANWSPSPAMAEVNLTDDARLTGENCTANNVEFHASDNSSVKVQLSTTDGEINQVEEGGQIQLISASSPKRHNVLMIAVDDLKAISSNHVAGKDHFLHHLYPDQRLRAEVQKRLTPNIDRLAAMSMEFTRATCSSPVCNPSRAAIMTGIPGTVSGLTGNYDSVFFRDWEFGGKKPLADAITLPELLKSNGWYTASSGKIFHSSSMRDESDFPRSWNDWTRVSKGAGKVKLTRWSEPIKNTSYGSLHQSGQEGDDDATFDQCADYRRADLFGRLLENGTVVNRDDSFALPKDSPFFLACGIFRPHAPYFVTKDLIDLFPISEMSADRELMNRLIADCDDLCPAGLRTTSVKRDGDKFVYNSQPFAMRLKAGLELQPGDGDLGSWASMIQHYLASVALADRCIGRLIDGLEASDHDDNTMVILWSDHGYHLGEKMHEAKYKLWDDAGNVMFMIHDPQSPKSHGKVYSKPVSLLDVYPTVASVAGIEMPDERQNGVDLSKVLSDPTQQRSDHVVGAWSANRPETLDMFIMNDTYRLLRFKDDPKQIELYKIDVDPNEETNLADDPAYATVIDDLTKQLDSYPRTQFRPNVQPK